MTKTDKTPADMSCAELAAAMRRDLNARAESIQRDCRAAEAARRLEASAQAEPVADTYYDKGKDADYFDSLSNEEFAWAMTCAGQDLADSDVQSVECWIPIVALVDGAADRIKQLAATPPAPEADALWADNERLLQSLNNEVNESERLRAAMAEAYKAIADALSIEPSPHRESDLRGCLLSIGSQLMRADRVRNGGGQ